MLKYTGKPGRIRVNGRPMKPGSVITDPQEIRDLQGEPDFEKVEPERKRSSSKPKKVSE